MYKLRIYYEVIVYHLTWWIKALNYDSVKEIQKIKKKLPIYHQLLFDFENDGLPNEELKFVRMNNQYVVRNNKWGIFKLKKPLRYIQNINTYPAWFYQTPIKNHGVLGYPEVKSKIIKKLSNLKSIWVMWSVHFFNNKMKYNLAFDFWLLNKSTWDWKEVKHEIMVWEDYHVSRPNGKRMGTVRINEIDYAVYSGWIDKSKEKNLGVDGWILTTFVRKNPQRKINKSGRINLVDCLSIMYDKNIISHTEFESLYLHNVELGTEVYNSVGFCIVYNFDVNVEEHNIVYV